MGKVDRSEKLTAGGYLSGFFGAMFCADAIGCARAYGYETGNAVEFAIGAACLIAATVMLYLAGMLRDRRIQEESARRRAARERRKAEREHRIR